MKLYLHSTNPKSPHLEYQVLEYNAETKMGLVTNLHTPERMRIKFQTNLDKDVLKKNNWVVSKKSYAELKKEATSGEETKRD